MARSDLPSALQYQQRYENIQNFIQFVKEVRVPPDFTFSYEDLTSENDVERPKVVDCVLWLKRLHEGHSPLPFNMPGLAAGGGLTSFTAGGGGSGGGGNDLFPEMDSSRKAAAMYSARSMSMKMSTSSTTATAATMAGDGGAALGPAAARGVPGGGVAGSGTSTGVAQLLSQLSVVLKAQSTHSIDITSTSVTQVGLRCCPCGWASGVGLSGGRLESGLSGWALMQVCCKGWVEQLQVGIGIPTLRGPAQTDLLSPDARSTGPVRPLSCPCNPDSEDQQAGKRNKHGCAWSCLQHRPQQH